MSRKIVITLLPCPLCGADPQTKSRKADNDDNSPTGRMHYVVCYCGGAWAYARSEGFTTGEAAHKWNDELTRDQIVFQRNRDLEVERTRELDVQLRERLDALELELRTSHDLLNHPKADLVWSKAWEHGHAGGESQIRWWYEEFAEVAK